MRKVSLILAVLLFTVPAWATVTITCQQVGTTNDVLVSYAVTGEVHPVRAFALDITVNNGVISAVDDNISTWYTIYPGSIVIVNGEVVKDGNAVADPCDLPGDTKGGIGTSGITVEMGALYSPPDDANGPPLTGNLLKFTNTVASGNTTVTIVENQSRGGVFLTDPNLNPTVTAPGCIILRECFPACHPKYAEWVTVGRPNCWCAPYLRQCHGDSDNVKEGNTKNGYYYAHFADLTLLQAGWNVKEPPLGPGISTVPNGICADFARDKEGNTKNGYYRVHFNDLAILLANWNVKEPPLGPGIPTDCLNCP